MYLSQVFDGQIKRYEVSGIVFDQAYDVIISGVGTAGMMALIMTAQNGLEVLGIESLSCPGGISTVGGVQAAYFDTPGGRYLEIEDQVIAHREVHTGSLLESRKMIGEQMALESGAQILYESTVCGVYLEKDTVCGVKVITPEGIRNISCKILMDCTGDVYTAHMAGCKTQYGRELDGLTQPYSMVSYLWARDKKGAGLTNVDCGRVDQYNDWELSRALIFSRIYKAKEEQADRQFLFHMPLLGIREGRRIVSEEDIKLEDIFAGRETKTPILYSYADLDKHGWDVAFDGEVLGDWSIGANLGAYNITIPVSYKSILPLKIEGLVVPCRGLGVDRDVSSCVRMLSDMRKIAEGAADMAMLALKYGCSLREIPYEELKERLTASRCLERTHECTYRRDGLRDSSRKPLPAVDVRFVSDPGLLEEKLQTLCPGEAIWAAKLMGEKAVPTLKKLLLSEKEDTRKHAAFALAITGNNDGNEILREMVRERDGTMLQDGRKLNQQRGCMAIYLLGRLGDVDIMDTLIEIICDEKEGSRPVYQRGFVRGTRYKIEGFQNEYFQFVSNAVMALIRIAEMHPEQRNKVRIAFLKAFEDGSYYGRITSTPRQSSEGAMVENIGKVARTCLLS